MSINQSFDNNFVSDYIRERRNLMLLESDKFMIPDFPITDEKREEWKVYRQRLRDITSVEGFENCSLNDIFEIQGLTWPEKPN